MQSCVEVVEPQVSATAPVRNAPVLCTDPLWPPIESTPLPSRWYTATRPGCGESMVEVIVDRISSCDRATFQKRTSSIPPL